jgi:hypothetical protein
MVGARVKTKDEFAKVAKAARRANIETLGHAGGYIRKVAQHSIKRSPKPSAPGTPPNTRRGQLRRAIRYAVEKVGGAPVSVVIGPDVDVVGTSATAHEFGGKYRREKYPKRPFMGPALKETQPKLPDMWAGSVK